MKVLDIRTEVVPDNDPDSSYLEQEGFEDRLAAYEREDFMFVGVRAVADIEVEGVRQSITSGGLWGIEDDSDESYIDELLEDQRLELVGILESMGAKASEIVDAKPRRLGDVPVDDINAALAFRAARGGENN